MSDPVNPFTGAEVPLWQRKVQATLERNPTLKEYVDKLTESVASLNELTFDVTKAMVTPNPKYVTFTLGSTMVYATTGVNDRTIVKPKRVALHKFVENKRITVLCLRGYAELYHGANYKNGRGISLKLTNMLYVENDEPYCPDDFGFDIADDEESMPKRMKTSI